MEATESSTEEDKPFWHCFWPLHPPPPDHKEVRLLASTKMVSEFGFDWYVCLLGRGTTIDVLGASVPSAFMKNGQPYQDLVGGALNRAFAALSLVYSPAIELLSIGEGQFISLGMFSDEKLPKSYEIQIEMPPPGPPNWDPQSLMTFVAHTQIPAAAVAALSEATRSSIPRHYRFLALCRALELLIPGALERSAWLDRYEDEFGALALGSMHFRNYVPRLRARCAHGQAGQEQGIFGMIASGVATEVFNLVMKAVIEKLAEISGIAMVAPTIPVREVVPASAAGAKGG